MKKHTVFILCIITSLGISCSTVQNKYIKVNQDSMIKQVYFCYKKNGNVFYLSSKYVNFSIVWTYYEDKVEIFRLQNGEIRQKQVMNRSNKIIHFDNILPKDIRSELYQTCPMVLDGDTFGFIIEVNHKKQKEDFIVDVNCLKHGQYKSDFLNRMVEPLSEKDKEFKKRYDAARKVSF